LSQGTAANTASGAFDCENCAAQAAQGLVVTGQVTLTTAIIKAIMGTYLETPESLLDRQGITQFLKKNLTWRVTTVSLSFLPSFHLLFLVSPSFLSSLVFSYSFLDVLANICASLLSFVK